MEKPTPRINASMIQQYPNMAVRVAGRVVKVSFFSTPYNNGFIAVELTSMLLLSSSSSHFTTVVVIFFLSKQSFSKNIVIVFE